MAHRLEMFKGYAGSFGNAGQGILGHNDRQAGRLAQHPIEIF